MIQFLLLNCTISTLQSRAQEVVAVSKEPLHKKVFENDYFRVLEVQIAPCGTTLFHNYRKRSA